MLKSIWWIARKKLQFQLPSAHYNTNSSFVISVLLMKQNKSMRIEILWGWLKLYWNVCLIGHLFLVTMLRDLCVNIREFPGTSSAGLWRKQSTANKLGIYSFTPLKELNVLLNSLLDIFQSTQNISDYYTSNQFSAAAITLASDEK